MKTTILTIFLMTAVCAGFAFAQTKKPTQRKRIAVKRAVTKKPINSAGKKMTNQSAANSAATTTASGLTLIVTKQGDGVQLKAGDNVMMNYTGLLTNGQKFDSSLDRGQAFTFPLGAGRVIKGWDEGVAKLRVGDHATLIIPPAIGYGAAGAGGVIPPNATLIFIVEILGVQQ